MHSGIGVYEILALLTVLVPWVLLCLAVGRSARKRRRNQRDWTVLAVFLSPLVGYILLLVLGEGNEISS